MLVFHLKQQIPTIWWYLRKSEDHKCQWGPQMSAKINSLTICWEDKNINCRNSVYKCRLHSLSVNAILFLPQLFVQHFWSISLLSIYTAPNLNSHKKLIKPHQASQFFLLFSQENKVEPFDWPFGVSPSVVFTFLELHCNIPKSLDLQITAYTYTYWLRAG